MKAFITPMSDGSLLISATAIGADTTIGDATVEIGEDDEFFGLTYEELKDESVVDIPEGE